MKRNYDAAKTSDLFGSWGASNSSADALLWGSLPLLRARSRDLMRNNPYAKRFRRMAISNVIGPQGITLQNRATDPNGKQDDKANNAIETAWWKWGMRCDVTGRFSFRQVCGMALGSVVADGEVLIRKVRGRGEFGLELQLVEIDHLPEHLNDASRNIRMGIERDNFGKATAYYLYEKHPTDLSSSLSQKLVRVPAEEIIHLYLPDRISQTRGIPWMHAAMTGLKMLGGYEEAELVAARLGAAKGGFYNRPAGEEMITGAEGSTPENPIQEVTPGMFEVLPEGWSFSPFDPTHPTTAFKDFVKAILRGISSGFDVSYAYLANDLEGVNYSSIRAGVLDERDMWMGLQSWFIESVLEDIYKEWLWMALLSGKVKLPFAKFDKFHAPQWMPRRWAWVDPLKDMHANLLAIKAGLKSPSMVAAEMGNDIEEVYEAIKRDEELRKRLGITTATDAELLQAIQAIGEKSEE